MKNYIYRFTLLGIFRTLFFVIILLFSFFILSLFQGIQGTTFFLLMSALVFIGVLSYLLFLEKNIVHKEYGPGKPKITVERFFLDNTEIFIVAVIIMLAFMGINAIKSKSIPLHGFIAVIFMSAFIGISLRTLFHNLRIGILLSQDELKFLLYLALIFTFLIIFSTSPVLTNSLYVTFLLVGLPLGIIIVSYKYYRQRKRHILLIFASQDFLLIEKLRNINKNDNLYRPLIKYMFGHLRWCLNEIHRIEKRKGLDSKQLFDLLLLKFRCYLRLGKVSEAHDLLLAIKESDTSEAVKIYQEYLYDIMLRKGTHLYRTFIDLQKSSSESISAPELLLNYSYLLNKRCKFNEASEICERLINRKNQIDPTLFVYALNNFCYSKTRHILNETGYFNILDSELEPGINFKKNIPFYYSEENSNQLQLAFIRINSAFTIVEIIRDNRQEGIHRYEAFKEISYLLNETKSLVQYAIGNFDVALLTLKMNLLKNYRQPSTYKLLAIINGTMGNSFAAKANFIEFKASYKESLIETNISNFDRDQKVVKFLISSPPLPVKFESAKIQHQLQ